MTKLKQTQEALKTVSDKKEQLILKYQNLINSSNKFIELYVGDIPFLKMQIEIYTEFINDLKFL